MPLMYRAKRAAQNGPGYMMWSILDGTSALRIPWRDIFPPGGHLDFERLRDIRLKLERFEVALDRHRYDHGDLPDLPTPNARVVEVDNSEFERELADRLEIHRNRKRRP